MLCHPEHCSGSTTSAGSVMMQKQSQRQDWALLQVGLSAGLSRCLPAALGASITWKVLNRGEAPQRICCIICSSGLQAELYQLSLLSQSYWL
jgi:hypothetical protein